MSSARDTSRRAAWWVSSPTGLLWLFFAGFLLRVVVSFAPGFPYDMSTFAAWADRMDDRGPLRFYPRPPEDYFVDYPPGYLYVLWVLARVSRLLTGGLPPPFLLKLPAMVADLVVAWFAVQLGARLTPVALKRRFPVRGAVAAAVLLNPALILVSAAWGQVDSVSAALVLGALLLLGTGDRSFRRESAGMAVLALAVGTKPQAMFVLPFGLVLLLWRHIRERRAAAPTGTVAGATIGGLGRVAALGAVSLATGLALMGSFGLTPVAAFRFFAEAGDTYAWTSVFAFNFWGAVGFWQHDTGPDAVGLWGIPALYLGLGGFAALGLAVVARAWVSLRRGEVDGRILVFGSVAITCVAFASLTRIHERYLFLGLACLAPLVSYRALRRAFGVLSALYFLNVYFPYIHYLRQEDLPTPTIDFLYDLVYGAGTTTLQLRFWSVLTGLVCLGIAWRGWRWIETRSGADDRPVPPLTQETVPATTTRWELELHPVRRRAAALALVAFVLVLLTRLAGLGDPSGMYFDEVYHARTAGEYLEGKDVYEWTHPPLAKELMAASIRVFGRFGTSEGGDAPPGLLGSAAASDGESVFWGTATGDLTGVLRQGRFGRSCTVEVQSDPIRLGFAPTVVAVSDDAVFAAGAGHEGPVLARVEDGAELWRVPLPGTPAQIATAPDATFVLTQDGSLLAVQAQGEVVPVAGDVTAIAVGTLELDDEVAVGRVTVAWAAMASGGRITAFGVEGTSLADIDWPGEPGLLVAPPDTERVIVAEAREPRIGSIVTEGRRWEAWLPGGSADILTTMPNTGVVWAVEGTAVRAIEPRGLSTIGRAELPSAPDVLLADAEHQRFVAVSRAGLSCVGGRPATAWRFGSALFGAVMAMFAMLIAIRLFGSLLAGGLAAFFVAVDGLAFVMSRIAMNDSYVTAFILGAWFCALSCLYRAGAEPEGGGSRSGRAALGWLAGCGVFAGLAIASKWVGLYALAGIGLVFLWDLWTRGSRGLAGVTRGRVVALILFALLLGFVPVAIYVASYAPYFALGNSLSDLVSLQQGMYHYHSRLEATHPYGSPWYGWPFGHRGVWVHLHEAAGRRAEIWAVANPVVFIGGLGALAALARAMWRRRSAALAMVLAAAAVQFVPWMIVGRVVFLYHYLPVVPFLAIALGWWIAHGKSDDARSVRWRAVVVGGLAVAVFGVLLPLLAGISLPSSYHEAVKGVFGWMF